MLERHGGCRTELQRLVFRWGVIELLKVVFRPEDQDLEASGRRRSRARAWVAFVASEPFFQFLAIGLLIWGCVEYWNAQDARYTIHLGNTDRQRIIATYVQQFGQPPTPQQLKSLTDRYIREEIFLHEGLALGLDRGDEIVRRRIVQKYEFLQTDLAVLAPPTADMLERWFEQEKQRYVIPERVAFSQVYFATDRDGEAAAMARAINARDALRRLGTSRASDLGDAVPGPADCGGLTPEEAAKVFGNSDLSTQLFTLPVASWAGPFRSGYGWHLIFVTGQLPAVQPLLVDVHARVLADYLEEQRQRLNARNFEKLRAKYTIRYDAGGR